MSARSSAMNRGHSRFPISPSAGTKIDAELSGFKKASRTNVVLRVAEDFSVDFELAAGDVKETVNVEASATPVRDARRRRLRRHHRRAGARAAAERPQLPAARDVDAGRERARLPERQGQGTPRRIGPLGQRQRRHRESLVGRRREQQRRRLEPHDSGVPVARGDPGVQDSPQQLRSRVRRRRRRADQHRYSGRHESLQRNAHSTRAAATR